MNKSLVGLILGLVLPLLAACGGAKEVEVEKAAPSLPAVEARRLQAEPAGVQDVIDLKAKAKVGDQVVVFGRVRKFSDGFASFVLQSDDQTGQFTAGRTVRQMLHQSLPF